MTNALRLAALSILLTRVKIKRASKSKLPRAVSGATLVEYMNSPEVNPEDWEALEKALENAHGSKSE